MLNKKIMILAIIFTCLLAVSTVSATENATDDIVSADAGSDVVSNQVNTVENGTDNAISANDNNQVITEGNTSVGSFADLQTEINNVEDGGVLNLTKDYKYVNGSTEGIQISKPITIDGQGHSIDGNKLYRMFYINCSNVMLKNLKFINGSHLEFGGAVYWFGSNGFLSNCSFVNCGVFSGSEQESNSCYSYGGAVYWFGSNGFLSNCSFVDCVASSITNGGATYGLGNSHSYGGAVYWDGNKGRLNNCSFNNCSALAMDKYHNPSSSSDFSRGGAIFLNGNESEVYNCNFINCSSITNGVAICWNGVNGTLYNSTFKNCLSVYGYGSVFWMGNQGILYECSFLNCHLNFCSGAYWTGDNGTINNCSFVNCSSSANGNGGRGGAISWHGANATLSNSVFVNCSSFPTSDDYYSSYHCQGGAIYWYCVNGVLNNCSFVNCSSSDGGAIYIDGGKWDENGMERSSCYDISLSDCYFMNCSASGSAIFWEYPSGIISNCTIINCPNAIYLKNDEKMDREYMTLINNLKFYNKIGGSVFCNGKSVNAIVNNTWFENNSQECFVDGGSLIIVKRNSELYAKNVSCIYQNITYNATLISDGVVLTNKEITFYFCKSNVAKIFNAYTNDDGIALLCDELDSLDVGTWLISIFFNGYDNYISSNLTTNITIYPPNYSLIIEDSNATVGHGVTLVANVNSTELINEGVVNFFDGEINIGEANVIDGVATLTYAPATAGEHIITAIFNSDNYLSSNSTAMLLVDSVAVDVLVDNGTVGYNSTFVANVKGLYSTINEGSVAFYIGDEYLGNVPVVDGSASLVYTPLTVGDYTVKAVFSGSDNFLDDESSSSFTVKNADSEIIINDLNGTVGHELTITVNVVSPNNLTINEGYIVFFDGSVQIGEANVENGVATLSYTPTTAGEHPITAMFYSANYGDSINSALLTVAKADIDLSIDYISDVYFTNPSNFAININSNSKPVNEGKIKYYVNNELVGIVDVYEGTANFDYVTDATGSFTLTAAYEETDNYFAKNASTTFTVNKMPTTLSGESVIFDEESYKTFTTELKDNNNYGVGGQPVKIEVIKYSGESATFNGISDANGITVYDVGRLAGGMWYVTGVYAGNDNYIESRFVDKFLVVRMNTTTEIEEIDNPKVNHNYKLKANIHDENGKLVKEGIVQFYLDGVDIGSIDLSNNQGHQSSSGDDVLGVVNPMFEYVLGADNDVSDLYINYVPTKAGKHTLTAVYEGTTIYKASNSTTSFDVSNSNTVKTTITASDVTTVYNGGKYIVITLKDVNGKLVNGVKVKVVLNKKTYTPTTKNGQVKISTNGLAPVKIYSATITFAGNANYAKSSKIVKVGVKKANPKIIASAKAYKVRAVKKYTVALKTNRNVVMKNTLVTIKVGKITLNARTNAKGVATFNLAKLTKGNFVATVKFAGNKYYNAKTVKAKITVR